MDNNVKVTQTNTGSHGIHWRVIFDKEIDTKQIMDRFFKTIETGQQIALHESLHIVTDSLVRGIIHNDTAITGFPYLKAFNYGQFKVISIVEWSHADNLEAIIKASHESGCGVSFFATDYAIHKDVYKTQKSLSINIVGLIYKLYKFNVNDLNQTKLQPNINTGQTYTFSEDFCGYFPIGEDEIQFIGRMQHMQEHSMGEISGYLIRIGITPDFSMEFFVARTNLSIELELNQNVCGIAWVQGTLEK